MLHELKTHPESYENILSGVKTFEFRKNDRGFKVNDVLWLRKYDPASMVYLSEDDIIVRVTHILHGPDFGIPEGYCIMSIKYFK